MSIYSTIYITLEKAREYAKSKLMHEQEKLIDLAIQSMEDFELTSHLNADGQSEYYVIEGVEND